MSQAVDALISDLMHNQQLTRAERLEFETRVRRGELFGERNLSTITVKVETADGEDPTRLVEELAEAFGKVIEDRYMLDGEELHGYDDTLAVRYDVDTEVGW